MDIWKEYAVFVALVSALLSLVVLVVNLRLARLTTSLSIMKQWQDFNLAVARDRDLAELISRDEFGNKGAEWVRKAYMTFYRLNIIHDVWQANDRWFMPRRHTLTNVDQLLTMMANFDYDQLQTIIGGQRGYTDGMKQRLLSRIKELAREGHITTDWGRLTDQLA